MADAKTTHLELIKQDPDTGYDYVKQDGNLEILDSEIYARGKAFNGQTVSADGEFHIQSIPYAENLETFASQRNTGDFIARATGGNASISDGDAWLVTIAGTSRHEGYVAQSINMTVTPMPREEGESTISATIDDSTFIAYVESASGTVSLTYSTDWSANPALYGITVTGTPVAGDAISVSYVKEARGTIIVSDPTSFVSTGWNLYNHTAGYARVVRYSEDYGFKISGTYTLLEFAETLDGERTTITPVSGFFFIPSDGYLFVSGGNNTNTAIWMTWGDWENGYEWDQNTQTQGQFHAYTEDVINLSSFMQTNFPYGLLTAGTVHDEINLNIGIAYSRVIRQAYNSTNLAAAKASGRQYEYDENYIYLERETVVTYDTSIEGGYAAYDHGMELFIGTDQELTAETMYGANLRNKLERDVLTISQQDLTASQKQQVLTNLGIYSDINSLNSFKYTGTLANNTNLNNVGTPGHYQLSSTYTYANAPADAYFLIVERSATNSAAILQICYGTAMCSFRFRTGATSWTYWTPVCLEAKNGSYSLGGCMANGYVSNSNTTDMYLEVPLYRKLPVGKSISLTSLKMEVRGDK